MRRDLAALFAALAAGAHPSLAQTGELGQVCVQDFLPSASCDANDVVASLAAWQIVDECQGASDTAEAVVRVTLTTGAVARYDIGTFLALDGGSALDGDLCYHDYLQPPLSAVSTSTPDGPFWNGELASPLDTCGDLGSGEFPAVKSQRAADSPLTLACADQDEDGVVDLSVCVSWDTTSSTNCTGLAGAVPLSVTRCSCARVDVEGLLTHVIFIDGFESEDTGRWSWAVP